MAMLKKELVTQRTVCNLKEKEHLQTITILESKVVELTKAIQDLMDQKLQDSTKYGKVSDELQLVQKVPIKKFGSKKMETDTLNLNANIKRFLGN